MSKEYPTLAIILLLKWKYVDFHPIMFYIRQSNDRRLAAFEVPQ